MLFIKGLVMCLVLQCSAADCSTGSCVQDETSLVQMKTALQPGTKKNVLFVIDMQKDYAQGVVTSKVLAPAEQAINALKSKTKFDLVVYTQDWLDPKYGFAGANTEGAELIESIAPKEGENHWIFTKSTDDAMNLLDDEAKTYGDLKTTRAFDGKRKFCIDPKVDGVEACSPLAARLMAAGFSPANTKITCVGTEKNRCVMKTAMHSKALGYETAVSMSASAGGEENKWKEVACKKGIDDCPELAETFAVPQPECKGCGPETIKKWSQLVFEGYHGGPALEVVKAYLATAGVEVNK